LYEALQSDLGFSKNDAETVLQLLHSPFDLEQPETYETLIAYLRHRRQAVRELAAWHLYRLAPIGQKIPFNAAASPEEHAKAAAAWKKLIPSGELPKDPMDETKEKLKEPAKPVENPKEKKQEDRPDQARTALLIIRVLAQATLTFNGEPTTQTGTERRFITPPLVPGRRYHYNVAATWSPNQMTTITRHRKVFVWAGKTTEVDLLKEDPADPDKVVIRGGATADRSNSPLRQKRLVRVEILPAHPMDRATSLRERPGQTQ
jgi:uncharacterized protein (TIGR03000 family)